MLLLWARAQHHEVVLKLSSHHLKMDRHQEILYLTTDAGRRPWIAKESKIPNPSQKLGFWALGCGFGGVQENYHYNNLVTVGEWSRARAWLTPGPVFQKFERVTRWGMLVSLSAEGISIEARLESWTDTAIDHDSFCFGSKEDCHREHSAQVTI